MNFSFNTEVSTHSVKVDVRIEESGLPPLSW